MAGLEAAAGLEAVPVHLAAKHPPRRPTRWVDDAESAGARTNPANGSAFNVLLRHEGLVRTCSALGGADMAHALTDGAVTAGGLAALLHERCSVHVRASFAADAAEKQAYQGRAAVIASKVLLPATDEQKAARLEPAELLQSGETAVAWRDASGARRSQCARWSADGKVLRLVVVEQPPPTHRQWVEALQQRSALCSSLVAADVMLTDADGVFVGRERVLPRLLGWADYVAGAVGDPASAHAALQVSRATHLPGLRTRVHVAGTWPTSAGGAPTLSLLQETIEWVAAPKLSKKERKLNPDAPSWVIRAIWRRGLEMPARDGGAPQPPSMMPMNLYSAAALAPSNAVLTGPADFEGEDGTPSGVDRGGTYARREPTGRDDGDDGDDDLDDLDDVLGGARARKASGEAEKENGPNAALERRVAAAVAAAVARRRWGSLGLRLRVQEAAVAAVAEAEAEADEERAAADALAGSAPPDPSALAYAGLIVLGESAAEGRSGEMFDTLEESAALVQLQGKGGPPSLKALFAAMDEQIEFTLCSGAHTAAPTYAPIRGKPAVKKHMQEKQFPRLAQRRLKSSQPAALLADGRTAVSFEVYIDGGESVERLQDVVEWADNGKVVRWCRVVEPLPTQRDWLTLFSKGKASALGELLSQSVTFTSVDAPAGSEPKVSRGKEEVEAVLSSLAARMGGAIHHIGRSRELSPSGWAWPGEPAPPPAEPAGPSAPSSGLVEGGVTAEELLERGAAAAGRLLGVGKPKGKGGPPPPVLMQAIMVGAWRPLGAKWYGEKEVALRETAEWTGRRITRIAWETLPANHPQALPVWARWRSRQLRARKKEARRRDAPPRPAFWEKRPAWDDAVFAPERGSSHTAGCEERVPSSCGE